MILTKYQTTNVIITNYQTSKVITKVGAFKITLGNRFNSPNTFCLYKGDPIE